MEKNASPQARIPILISIIGFLLLLSLPVFAESDMIVERDGKLFTLHAYTDIERSAEYVWPYIWEFSHLKGFIDNARIDSVAGGEDWYDVKITSSFPLVSLVVYNHKWIMEDGVKVGSKMKKHSIDSPLPLDILESESLWSVEPRGGNRCRIHYESRVKVEMAGMEGLYTGIARRDGKRIMKNFKKYVEDGK